MNIQNIESETTGIDRFPDVDATASPLTQECRATIAGRKGSLPAPYGLLTHSPSVAHAFDAMSTALWTGDVPRRVTEGLFLVNARRHLCRYQWVRHVEKAREAGLANAVIDSLAIGEEPSKEADPAFNAAWHLADKLQQSGPVSDQLFDVLGQHYDSKAIAELTAFCGFASIVSNALRVRQPPIPAGSGNAPF